MITRIGKIGRLPKNVRDLLGTKIWDGVPGKEIAEWLNSLPEVQAVLAKQFGNQPVTEQNVSHWKQTGHAEWERQLQRRELVVNVGADAEELGADTGGRDISDLFANLVAAEVVNMAQVMLEEEPDLEKRWARLREVNQELSRLRRDDHRAARTLAARAEWHTQQEQTRRTAELDPDREYRKLLCAGYEAKLQMREMTEKFGGGVQGRNIAGLVLEVQNHLPPGVLAPGPEELKEWTEWDAKFEKFLARKHGATTPAPATAKENGSNATVAGDPERTGTDEIVAAQTAAEPSDQTREGNRHNARDQNSDAKAQAGESAGLPDPTVAGKIQPNPS